MIRMLACTSSLALAATLLPGAAIAQPAATRQAEEVTQVAQSDNAADIVVTARRREESVRDVPSTITAQTAEQILARGPLDGTGDLLQQVPGVRFNGVSSENLAEISIRGSGTQRATSADSGVGLFVNGAYVGSSTLGGRNFKRIDYFDIARVEVLEGPQGALYGRNSEFGTVNIVLVEPQFRNGGRVSATYTNELEQLRLEGILNQQLSDNVAVRFGAQITGQNGGQYYNPIRDEYYDHTNGYIFRGQIRYRSGPLDVTFLADVMDMNLPSFANQWVLPPGRLPALPLGYTGPRYDIPSEQESSLHQTVQRMMLIGDYDFGWGKLTSTSMASWSLSQQRFPAAIDLATQAEFQRTGQIGLYPLGRTATDARDETFYQDLHLTGDAAGGDLDWLAGVEALVQEDYYVRDQATSPCPVTLNAGICGGTPAAPLCFQLTPAARPCPATFPLPFGTRRIVPSYYRSFAAYGGLTYQIGNLSLNGELRVSRDYKRATQQDFLLYTTTPATASSTFEFEKTNFSYSGTISYRFTQPLPILLYASTGTGYRAGGVNNGIFNPNAPNPLRTTYDNETTTSYEIGIKADITPRIFFRLSAYTQRTEDAITSISDGCTVANACAQVGTVFNVNGGTVRSRGIEAALDANIPIGAGRLLLGVTAGHQDAKFVEVPTGVTGLPIVDTPIAQSPRWTLSANANLRQPIATDLTGFANIAYYGQSGGGQDTVTVATPFIPLEDFSNVDLRVGVEYRRLELAVFVRNLTNEIYPVLKLQQGTIPLVNRYNRPRQSGVSATFRW